MIPGDITHFELEESPIGEVEFHAQVVEGFPCFLQCGAVEDGEWGDAFKELVYLGEGAHGAGEIEVVVGERADS